MRVRVLADEDEREQRPRERPLVGALLEDNHVQQRRQLHGEGSGGT